MFDLRRRGKVSDLSMVGTTGSKFPQIREHFQKNIGDVYRGLDLDFKGFPEVGQRDPEAFKRALRELPPKSAVIIFTPCVPKCRRRKEPTRSLGRPRTDAVLTLHIAQRLDSLPHR